MMLNHFLMLLVQSSVSFWTYWGDGKAEINSYSVQQMRYREPRTARVFTIYVTEPFNLDKQVKADNPQVNNPAFAGMLKLNRVKKYQTGIYDYSLMSSVFVPVGAVQLSSTDKTPVPTGVPLKITFSSQEWCGQVFHQLNRRANGMQSSSYSYFETEGDTQQTLQLTDNTYFADELFIAVRELVKPFSTTSIVLYPTLEQVRLAHRPITAEQATVSKTTGTARFQGKNHAVTQWKIAGSSTVWTFAVEQNYPHRVLNYECNEGGTVVEKGELRESVRLPYWKLNSTRDNHYRTALEKFK